MQSLLGNEENEGEGEELQPDSARAKEPEVLSLFDSGGPDPSVDSNYKPETVAETARRSGLAMSAGIVFFGSVVFMLVIGWGADLLFGSSPWGMVSGIIIGSLIGFIQFFRLSSQIFK